MDEDLEKDYASACEMLPRKSDGTDMAGLHVGCSGCHAIMDVGAAVISVDNDDLNDELMTGTRDVR